MPTEVTLWSTSIGHRVARGRALVVSGALAVLVLAGCDDDAEPDPGAPDAQPVLEVDTSSPVCLDVDDDLPAEVEELPVIDCAQSHTHEIFATVEYTLKDVYPGLAELEDFAQLECLKAFEPFVGISAFDSSLGFTWLVPSFDGWNDEDDREVLCVLLDREGAPLTGTMKASEI